MEYINKQEDILNGYMGTRQISKWVDYKEVPYGLEREIDCMEKLEFETLDK
jgi:hypothetical protein